MLSRRVILCLTFVDGVLFRTKRFRADYRYTQAYSWAPDADELVLIDITRDRTPESRSMFYSIVEKYCREAALPMTVGGGVRGLGEAIRLLNLGGDKILIGWEGREVWPQLAERCGCNAIVAGIDFDGDLNVTEGHGTRTIPVTVGDGARLAASLGAGEVLLTSVARDGSLAGFDLRALRETAGIGIPRVIAGGCGSWGHVADAFRSGAAGAATSNIFHLTATAMRACKQYLVQNYDGPIRPLEAA